MRRRLRGRRGESMLGCRGPKGGGEIGRREEVHPLTRQRGGERSAKIEVGEVYRPKESVVRHDRVE